jgi:predicted TIM-barrel fold metal-dependent hydrolase
MSEWSSKVGGMIDSHVHMQSVDGEERLLAIREAVDTTKMAQVAIQNPAAGSGLPAALYMKARYPAWFYCMAGLNHAERLANKELGWHSLVEQVDALVELGCDGIKMIEGKPTSRQRLNVPVTDAYYADYWARVQELGLPIVWHVNDPEEFWDPLRIPGWAKERNWGYGPEDVQKEQLYAEVEEVLTRYPKLRIIFAHFYFLSADLPRAERFLERHPTAHLDLAPGVEMLYNMSRDPEASRAFFIAHADRIVFGTDMFSGLSVDEGRYRAGIVIRWLETEDTFRVPEGADFLLGPPADGVIRGMALPEKTLQKIYRGNAARLLGAEPQALNVERAIVECDRLADLAERMSGAAAAETEAAWVAARLRAGGR